MVRSLGCCTAYYLYWGGLLLVYKLLKLFDRVLDGAEHSIYRLADVVARLIARPRRWVLARLSSIESRRLAEMVFRCGDGFAESRYADPEELVEELGSRGFKKILEEDIGTGYEIVLESDELRKTVSITWKCKTIRTCTLLLSWKQHSQAH